MPEYIGKNRKARICYGFDEVAIVPSPVTIDPELVDISFKIGKYQFSIPIIASAMDGVVDVNFAILMYKLGGLAILNLEGIYTRYEDSTEVIEKIISSSPEESTAIIQKVYQKPIKEELVYKRIRQIKEGGGIAAVSVTPHKAFDFLDIAKAAGVDIYTVQGTVVTARYISKDNKALDFRELKEKLGDIVLIVGNCVTYQGAMELFETQIDGLLIGVGPGSACTTRGVLGIGVPQITAIVDCAQARDIYFKNTNRYVAIIADGGMKSGGDICKAIAAGADAVMLGSTLAKAEEAPAKGYHWGMATPHRYLPRGVRIHVGISGTLEEILYGPAVVDDGSQNLVGALRVALGMCGARNIRQMQNAQLIIAPSIKTEGKLFQKTQKVGMGKES